MPRPDHTARRVRPGTPHAAHRRDPTPTVTPAVEVDAEVVEPDEVIDPPDAGAPNLARAAVTVIGHTGTWAAGAYLRAGRRMMGVVVAPGTGLELVRDLASETTRAFVTAAEATELERRLDEAGPAGALIKRAGKFAGQLLPLDLSTPANGTALVQQTPANGTTVSLREQGEALLRRSRDVDDDAENHPAYSRILSELAPDEARILKLMLLDGPQPTVDVRTGGPLGLINSRLLAPGLSMIGPRAGARHPERVPSYLNNLFRLGLIWFSRETLRDHQRYQVLEAQPDVLEAIHSVSAARVVRRSVHLTPFGEDFCRTCLTDPFERLDALPAHSAPKVVDPQPPADLLEP